MHMTTTAREQTIKRLVEWGMVPQMLCKFGCGCRNRQNCLWVHNHAHSQQQQWFRDAGAAAAAAEDAAHGMHVLRQW